MVPTLNRISKQNRRLYVFSLAKSKIDDTVRIINEMEVDARMIMNNSKEAYDILTKIFKSISSYQFNQLIDKCYISDDGKLRVKE